MGSILAICTIKKKILEEIIEVTITCAKDKKISIEIMISIIVALQAS